ncbi:manganese/iron transporter ATP-binding protein [Candidatus Liberibacter solanacearum]|uniref:Manganese ABC transporter, ATP-binding protein SitB n=1 Tax=Candidatus Liberibacter solanacearum TaxID=556287 RepID=A0A094YZY7_9HYPH|nr:ATP-binding cassette domain-containing protein [Candidatus Liberibacter solanacearum]KGB27540.1 manganese/iron transporter ATP-binding protein [Candidatus Liberibacter solanacearum]KJZ80784.1 manganese/iron transporter ATP-binding protein [Candidatus Liberibacter solanacearum]KJZ81897.1 Manganese ABC transporter, ATP-binding protein SitB [Candidatus Liberibacter solanacearum]KQC49651.1 manganese/iron transporter ATP-binding protein [Candidatus Liberibacter solanacearum]
MSKYSSTKYGIEVKDVSVTYRNGYRALKNISFSIPDNTITALIGVNGAGKSTLFQSIMGFVPIDKGSISIFNNTVENALKGDMISYIPQVESIDWTFPILVEDVVMMGRYRHMNWLRIPSIDDHRIVTEALENVGIAFMRKRQIGELSVGQQKRVFLARALAKKSRVIILDEPFAAIDFKTEREVISLLQELRNEDRMILVSTHNINSVPSFCDQTIFLKQTIISYGLTSDTFNQENIKKTFGVEEYH